MEAFGSPVKSLLVYAGLLAAHMYNGTDIFLEGSFQVAAEWVIGLADICHRLLNLLLGDGSTHCDSRLS
jgi:hypothetical protein